MGTRSVVIAGGGPTGLMLAAELKLAQVDVLIVERRTAQALETVRAGGLHARTLEVLDQRGVAERFVAEGQPLQVVTFGAAPLDISDFPTRYNHGLALFQDRFEVILAQWVLDGLGVPILRGREVTGFTAQEAGVEVRLSDGASVWTQYLVGCDGGRSLVRRTAGIEFPGWDASVSYLLAEARMTGEPAWGLRRSAQGSQAIAKLADGRARIVLADPVVKRGEQPDLEELRAALLSAYGSDFGLQEATWISRFSDAARQAASYRAGRILLAGDAAHIHSPVGGQGLNLGVQDAVNLGWKLAQVVHGTSPAALLDSYQAERHPVGARVLKSSLAMTALARGDERSSALRDLLAEVLQVGDARRQVAGMLSGLDIRYELGAGHPLLGRRMPDLEVLTASGPRRVFSFLHRARPLLLNLGRPDAFAGLPSWGARVPRIDAQYPGAWELPVIGPVAAPSAVLVRPDGHVAWVGEGTTSGLAETLNTWFGAPTATPAGV